MKVTKRQYLLVGLMLLAFATTFIYSQFTRNTKGLLKYTTIINQNLNYQEHKVMAFMQDKQDFIARQISGNTLSEYSEEDIKSLDSLHSEPYTLFLYKNDSLVLWSNNRVAVSLDSVKNKYVPGENNRGLAHLTNGIYEIYKTKLPNSSDGLLVAAIPIKNKYTLQSKYLNNVFVADWQIPKIIEVQSEVTDYPLISMDGQNIAYLGRTADIKDRGQQKTLLFLYLVSTLLLCILINDFAQQAATTYHPWIGAAILVIVTFGLRYLGVSSGFIKQFYDIQSVQEAFTIDVLGGTLGDLLINILLLLWMMVFFHSQFTVRSYVDMKRSVKVMLTSLNYFSIILGLLMITGLLQSLVLDSGLSFDFDNIFDLNSYSLLAVVGIILILFALFLFTHRMMLTIKRIELIYLYKLLSLVITLVVTIPLINQLDLNIPTIRIIFVAFTYILLFDLFVKNDMNKSLTWLGIWLVSFAALAAGLLYKYNKDRVFAQLERYAEKLAEPSDETLNISLISLKSKLNEYASSSWEEWTNIALKDSIFENSSLVSHIDSLFLKDAYLVDNYDYDVLVTDATYKTLIKAIHKNYTSEEILEYINQATPKVENLEYWDVSGKTGVFLKIPISEYGLLVSFRRKIKEPSKVFTELLLETPFKKLKNLSDYDYAIYRNGVEIEKRGKLEKYTIPEESNLANEPIIEYKASWVRADISYHKGDTFVVIGKKIGSPIKPVSLFSYLFVILIITVLAFAGINSIARILPDSLNINFKNTASLRNKMQLGIILLVLISFAIIGVVTLYHFKESSIKYHSSRLDRKVRSVVGQADHEILKDGLTKKDFESLAIISPLSAIHRMDINIYDIEGNLINSSEKNIFSKGIVAPKMHPIALYQLTKNNQQQAIAEEYIGSLSFQVAYNALNLTDGSKVFIGLPYYSEKRELKDQGYNFLGTLINVYVFLLIVAGAIAIWVANSVTRPISQIGAKLQGVSLGKNEPIEWKSKDEIGDLITAYNNMILKLEESTNKLKLSEREGAWRQMAQQVAHEIKNPLTPMKLNLQYLQRAFSMDVESAERIFNRVAKTVLEQMDVLDRIATSFSGFAKMPQAENEEFNLNELLKSVQVLFKDMPDVQVSLLILDPTHYYTVYADKDQLNRVFTNLVKNAQQAIPKDRKGKIVIELGAKAIEDENIAIVKISDNGTGIPEEMKKKVFYPNFTTKSSGSGLGLFMSKSIITGASGKIYFETIMDVGTDFYVELPIMNTGLVQKEEKKKKRTFF